MNKVILIGNLTKDPELKETQSGISVCKFSIAVNRKFQNADGERETDFFNITAWRGTAESIAKYCKKGNKLLVEGSIQLRKYEDEEGVSRTSIDITANEVEFLTPKSRQDDDEEPPVRKKGRPELPPVDDDDDLPF